MNLLWMAMLPAQDPGAVIREEARKLGLLHRALIDGEEIEISPKLGEVPEDLGNALRDACYRRATGRGWIEQERAAEPLPQQPARKTKSSDTRQGGLF